MEICHGHSLDIPGLAKNARDEKALLRIRCIMKKSFKEHESMELDGFEIKRVEYNDGRHPRGSLEKVSIRCLRPTAPNAPNA